MCLQRGVPPPGVPDIIVFKAFKLAPLSSLRPITMGRAPLSSLNSVGVPAKDDLVMMLV